MTQSSSHACDACGGTGRLGRTWVITAFGPVEDISDCANEPADTRDVPCPVCHGSGRISDVMPVSDALADAETLRRFARQDNRRNSESKESIYVGVASLEARRARHWLYMAIDWTPRRDFELFDDRRTFAVHSAENAARAAFRAVPGLRGE